MPFSDQIREEALVRSARRCCVCREVGRDVVVHHIVQEADGGPNTLENAIPLCGRCHGEAGHYNPRHPIGTKYSPSELKRHRDLWWALVAENPNAVALARIGSPNLGGFGEHREACERGLAFLKALDGVVDSGFSQGFLTWVSSSKIESFLQTCCMLEVTHKFNAGNPEMVSLQREILQSLRSVLSVSRQPDWHFDESAKAFRITPGFTSADRDAATQAVVAVRKIGDRYWSAIHQLRQLCRSDPP
jgi:hypothetical protein